MTMGVFVCGNFSSKWVATPSSGPNKSAGPRLSTSNSASGSKQTKGTTATTTATASASSRAKTATAPPAVIASAPIMLDDAMTASDEMSPNKSTSLPSAEGTAAAASGGGSVSSNSSSASSSSSTVSHHNHRSGTSSSSSNASEQQQHHQQQQQQAATTTTAAAAGEAAMQRVRIRNHAPPDPQFLSQIGCRCLVIDLPGVLLEDLKVFYDPRCGHVRVLGTRTVGRIKTVRKKLPINHEQVVTHMLAAFLSQGVLVIVAPTKIAAAMAAAVVVASRLQQQQKPATATAAATAAAAKTTTTSNTKPIRPTPLLLLTKDPANPDLPVVTRAAMMRTNSKSLKHNAKDVSPVGSQLKSAFEPYVPPRTHVDDSTSSSKSSSSSNSASDDAPLLAPEGTNNINPTDTKDNNDDDRTPCKGGRLQQYIQELEDEDGNENNNSAKEYYGEDEVMVYDLPEIPEDDDNDDDDEKPVTWSDDSLRDEPSENHSTIHLGMESSVLSPIPEYTTPHNNNHNYNRDEFVESPGITQMTNGRTCRPLTWVQFDTSWQDEVQSVVSHNSHGGSNSGTFPAAKNKENEAVLLPFEDELLPRPQRRVGDDNHLKMELEPHPYWKSAPFLPSCETPTGMNSSSSIRMNHANNASMSHDNTATPNSSSMTSGPKLAPRPSHQHLLHPRFRSPGGGGSSGSGDLFTKSPSPSSLLRRGKDSSPVSSTLLSPRKTVTWVDEI